MTWLQVVVGSIISATSVVAIAGFILRESFTRILDRSLERFKHELQIEAKTRELALESQIEFKERQLSELYGPIYAMLKRGRAIVALSKEGKLSRIEEAYRTLAKSTNSEIERLIITKSNLIDGDAIPASFIRYLIHVPLWHAFLDTPEGVDFEPEEFPEVYYTEEFETDVYQTTERLKKELHDLYRQYGLVSR